MKRIALALLLAVVLLIATPGLAVPPQTPQPDHIGQSYCSAQTTCWNGNTIWCQTTGDGCTWSVNPHVSVRCTGYDIFGDWVTLSATC